MSSAANAALTVISSQAAFNAAVSNAATDTYDDLTGSLEPSPQARTVAPYSYNVAIADGIFAAGSAADRWLAGNLAADPIVMSGFAGGVGAIGGFFFNTDLNARCSPD